MHLPPLLGYIHCLGVFAQAGTTTTHLLKESNTVTCKVNILSQQVEISLSSTKLGKSF